VQYVLDLSRHFIVLPKLGIAYGRIPKVADTTIRRRQTPADSTIWRLF